MAQLKRMPPVTINQHDLALFGQRWAAQGERLSRTPPQSSAQLGSLFDTAVAEALATMLGDIPIVPPESKNSLIPPQADCVEVGEILVVGGVRPQKFDVCYRPDGVRFALDSKTLNDTESVKKNRKNMINDLATEASTVHSRFPHAVVAFIVIIPSPCLLPAQRSETIETLERLARRVDVSAPAYMAEAISLVAWNPVTGTIDPEVPHASSPLRIERFSDQVEAAYTCRYKGFPPHDV